MRIYDCNFENTIPLFGKLMDGTSFLKVDKRGYSIPLDIYSLMEECNVTIMRKDYWTLRPINIIPAENLLDLVNILYKKHHGMQFKIGLNHTEEFMKQFVFYSDNKDDLIQFKLTLQ